MAHIERGGSMREPTNTSFAPGAAGEQPPISEVVTSGGDNVSHANVMPAVVSQETTFPYPTGDRSAVLPNRSLAADISDEGVHKRVSDGDIPKVVYSRGEIAGESDVDASDSPSTLQLVHTRTGNPSLSSAVTIIETGEILGRGSEGFIRRVHVVSEKAPDRPVPMACKEFHHSTPLSTLEYILENHGLVRAAHIPTYTTLRTVPDEGLVLMTDLTDGGKNVVLSTRDITRAKVEELYATRPDMMAAFRESEPLTSEIAAGWPQEYVENATEAGLDLPGDAWFTVIHPDGSSLFVVGDYGRVLHNPTLPKDVFRRWNTRSLSLVRETMSHVQRFANERDRIRLILDPGWAPTEY